MFFLTCLLHLIQLTIMYFPLGWKVCSVCQVKYLNGYNPIWNNASRECLFAVFYLTVCFFVIWCTTRFSSWSSGVHNVYPSSWDHCATTLGVISLVSWWQIAIYITASWQWVKFLLFLEEFRTLYCRYSAMDDSKSSKTKR